MFTVDFYESDKGDKPALDSILAVKDVKLRAKIFRSLKLLETFGNRLGEPDTAYLRDGLFELRTKHGSNIFRCIYFYGNGKIIVVTNGFVKKSQKTPSSEIDIALRRKAEYEKKNK